MEPISKIAGKVTHLDRADVDTDQMMPKQFLKRPGGTMSGAILRPRSLMCAAHFAPCVLVSLAPRPSWEACI